MRSLLIHVPSVIDPAWNPPRIVYESRLPVPPLPEVSFAAAEGEVVATAVHVATVLQ